jgi:nucleoside-diphosphate-sugar epimerase
MLTFVTGGSGFVGRSLIAALRARGHEVRALARSDAAVAAVERAGATAVRGDLDDEAALAAGMAGCAVVFHAAAKVEVWGRRADFQRVNIDGTRRVCAAARAAGVRRLVHVSTEADLLGGPPLRDADETWPLPERPLGMYPWSKGQAENVVRGAAGLETVIVRPRFVWGAGDTTLLPRLVEMVKAGRFGWIGGGRARTSTCHVDNLCAALLLAAERGVPGATYFVTDGEVLEQRDFLTRLLATQGVVPGPRSIPAWAAMALATIFEGVWSVLRLGGEPPLTRTAVKLIGADVTVSDARIRRDLGFVPPVTVDAGLRAMRG